MYREYAPYISLSPYIDTYWVSEGFIMEEFSHSILPDGCVDIIFSFIPPVYAGQMEKSKPYIVGTMTESFNIRYLGKVSIMGIRFRPVGITAFTRVPINEFTNVRVDMSLVETIFDTGFYDTMDKEQTMEERIAYLNNYFCRKLPSLHSPDKQIVYAAKLIGQTHGRVTVAEIAKEVCICQRHFERRFKASVGITPKSFSRIMKFKNAYKFMQEQPSLSLDTVAEDCGYYDHSHLIKEMKHMTGNLPADIRH